MLEGSVLYLGVTGFNNRDMIRSVSAHYLFFKTLTKIGQERVLDLPIADHTLTVNGFS